MGGIIFWIIACFFAAYIHRKIIPKESRKNISVVTTIILAIFFLILLFLSSLLIPEEILDAGWYRALWVLFAPLTLSYLIAKNYFFSNLTINLKGIKITNINISLSLLYVIYSFPFSTSFMFYILHLLGLW